MSKTGAASLVLFASLVLVACSGKNPPAPGDGSAGAAGELGGGAGDSGSAGVSGTAGTGAAGAAGNAGAAGGGAGTAGAAGGGSGSGAAGGGALAEDPFPLADGGTIVTRHNGGQGMWDETTTITATTYMSKPAFELVGSADPSGDTTTTILFVDGTKTYRATKDISNGGSPVSTTEYTDPGFLRFDSAWSKLTVGATEMHSYTRTLTKTGGSPAVTMSEHKYTIESLDESVTVAAGKFDHCLRVLRARVLGPGGTPMADDVKTYWFCPGVGKVKEVAPNASSTEELVSCDIPGGACP